MNRHQMGYHETDEVQRLNNPVFFARPWISPQPEPEQDKRLATPFSNSSRIFRQWPTGQSYACPDNTTLEKSTGISPERAAGANKSFWSRYTSDPFTPWGAPKKLENLDVDVESAFTGNSRKPLVLDEIEAKIDFGPETPPAQQKKIKMVFSTDEKMRQFKDKLEKQLAERKKNLHKNPPKIATNEGARDHVTWSCMRCLIWVTLVIALSAIGLLMAQFIGLVSFPFNSPSVEIEVNICGVMTSVDPNTKTSFDIDPIALSDLISKTNNHWSIFKLTETLICSQIQKIHRSVTSCKLQHFDTSRRTAKLKIVLDMDKLKEAYKLKRSAPSQESVVRILKKSMLSNQSGNFRIRSVELHDLASPKLVQLEIDLISSLIAGSPPPSQSFICNKLTDSLNTFYDPLHCRCDVRFNISKNGNQLTTRVYIELLDDKLLEGTGNFQVSDGSWCRDAKLMVSKHITDVKTGGAAGVVSRIDPGVARSVAPDVAATSSGVISSVVVKMTSCEEGCGEGKDVLALGQILEEKKIPTISTIPEMASRLKIENREVSKIMVSLMEAPNTQTYEDKTEDIDVDPRQLIALEARAENQSGKTQLASLWNVGGTTKEPPKVTISDDDVDSFQRQIEAIASKELNNRHESNKPLMPKAVPYPDGSEANDVIRGRDDKNGDVVIDSNYRPIDEGDAIMPAGCSTKKRDDIIDSRELMKNIIKQRLSNSPEDAEDELIRVKHLTPLFEDEVQNSVSQELHVEDRSLLDAKNSLYNSFILSAVKVNSYPFTTPSDQQGQRYSLETISYASQAEEQTPLDDINSVDNLTTSFGAINRPSENPFTTPIDEQELRDEVQKESFIPVEHVPQVVRPPPLDAKNSGSSDSSTKPGREENPIKVEDSNNSVVGNTQDDTVGNTQDDEVVGNTQDDEVAGNTHDDEVVGNTETVGDNVMENTYDESIDDQAMGNEGSGGVDDYLDYFTPDTQVDPMNDWRK